MPSQTMDAAELSPQPGTSIADQSPCPRFCDRMRPTSEREIVIVVQDAHVLAVVPRGLVRPRLYCSRDVKTLSRRKWSPSYAANFWAQCEARTSLGVLHLSD